MLRVWRSGDNVTRPIATDEIGMSCGIRDCAAHKRIFAQRKRMMHAVSFNVRVWN